MDKRQDSNPQSALNQQRFPVVPIFSGGGINDWGWMIF